MFEEMLARFEKDQKQDTDSKVSELSEYSEENKGFSNQFFLM